MLQTWDELEGLVRDAVHWSVVHHHDTIAGVSHSLKCPDMTKYLGKAGIVLEQIDSASHAFKG